MILDDDDDHHHYYVLVSPHGQPSPSRHLLAVSPGDKLVGHKSGQI